MQSRMAKAAILSVLCVLLPVLSYAGNVGKITGMVVDKST